MAIAYLCVFCACVVLSVLLTRNVRNFATRHNLVAAPKSDRHIHRKPVPRIGGVAVVLSCLICVWTFVVIVRQFHLPVSFPARIFLVITGPALLIFILGLVDDLKPLSPKLKFGVEALAAVLLYVGGLRIGQFQVVFGHHAFGTWAGLVLTVFWVLLITNAFNLLDGLDGLAAGSALFAVITLFVVNLIGGNLLISVLSLALAGSILGFLPYNFNPATIFMGDSGSLFIGFMLSAVALATSQKSPTMIAVAIPIVSFGLPIADTAISVVRRFMNGKPLFSADREHIHHKLLSRGLTHRQSVIVLYAVSASFAMLSLLLLNKAMSGVALAVLGIGVILGIQRLGYTEFSELKRVAQRTLEQKDIIANNLAFRRASEELSSASTFTGIKETLVRAFEGNDYDSFDLRYSGPNETSYGDAFSLRWIKPSRQGYAASWTLTIELVTSASRRMGTLAVSKVDNIALLTDINCLTCTGFTTILANALLRAHDNDQKAEKEANLKSRAATVTT